MPSLYEFRPMRSSANWDRYTVYVAGQFVGVVTRYDAYDWRTPDGAAFDSRDDAARELWLRWQHKEG